MYKKLKTKVKQHLAMERDRAPDGRDNDDSEDAMDPEMIQYIQRLAADPTIPRSNLDDQLVKRHQDYQRLKQLVAS